MDRKSVTVADRFLDPPKVGELESAASKILSEFRPKKEDQTDLEKPTHFNVPMTRGGTMARFRFPENSGELRTLKLGIAEFVQRIQGWQEARDKKKADWLGVGEAYKNSLSIRNLDPDDICNAYILHYWSDTHQSGGKFNESDCLTMVAYEPFLVQAAVDRIYAIFEDWRLALAFGGIEEKKANSEKTTTETSSDTA